MIHVVLQDPSQPLQNTEQAFANLIDLSTVICQYNMAEQCDRVQGDLMKQ